jgi:predicted esterase
MSSECHLSVQRTARYYVLGGPTGDDLTGMTELWIVCHGYGQLAGPFLESFASLATPTRRIVAPEALSRFYLDRVSTTASERRVGATWMTREDRDHEIADQVAYLDALHAHLLPPRASGTRVRLRVLGFSQGVATVARWLAFGRVRADELILWAGAFPPELGLASFAERLHGAPVVLVVGDRDELASWAGADAHLHRFTAAGIDARLVSFEGGHRLDAATLAALAAVSVA